MRTKKMARGIFGVSAMCFLLAGFGLQDLLHNQVVPNTPIFFITATFAIWYFSKSVYAAIVSFMAYFFYYCVHFLVLGYHYYSNPATITVLVFVLPHLIGYFYLKQILAKEAAEKELMKYKIITSKVETKIDNL